MKLISDLVDGIHWYLKRRPLQLSGLKQIFRTREKSQLDGRRHTDIVCSGNVTQKRLILDLQQQKKLFLENEWADVQLGVQLPNVAWDRLDKSTFSNGKYCRTGVPNNSEQWCLLISARFVYLQISLSSVLVRLVLTCLSECCKDGHDFKPRSR